MHEEGEQPTPVVHLFGRPRVRYGSEQREVPAGSRLLLAFVALQRVPVDRIHVAGTLWPSVSEARAVGDLRSALWRLRRAGIDVVQADKRLLWLAEDAEVDVHRIEAWATRLINDTAEPGDLTVEGLPDDACSLFRGWYADWAVLERERIRQRVLHGLERLSVMLSERTCHGEAVAAATRAVACEPLRESAQRCLINAHLAAGAPDRAAACYRAFAHRLRAELGAEPSRRITALVQAQGDGRPSMSDRYLGGSSPRSLRSSSR